MNRIALLRKARKLNQKEFGIIIGVAQNTVSNWENGNREPDHKALKEMASFFDCSIDYLLGHENEEEKPTPVSGDGQIGPAKQDILDMIDDMDEDELLALVELVKAAKKMRNPE